MAHHELTRAEARRIAVRAQRLDAQRPTDLVDLVRHLTLLQIDPTAAVAPAADLVAYSRLGDDYRPQRLTAALEQHRSLFELDALVRPMDDLPLFLDQFARAPRREGTRAWLEANAGFHRDVLDRLRDAGPLSSRDIPDTSQVPWASTGWTNQRNVTQLLEILAMRGEVAISHRVRRERHWDLAERVYPAGLEAVPFDEAQRIRAERRLRALGIARERAPEQPVEPVHVGAVGDTAEVEGVPGVWRVDPRAVAMLAEPFEGRTALLSPFDRLSYDRVRAVQLFDFEYVLEMYKPAAKRRWGYFALPVLHGDALVGKVDAAADRKRGAFVVAAVHEDVPFDAAAHDGVRQELTALAAWLGLELELPRGA